MEVMLLQEYLNLNEQIYDRFWVLKLNVAGDIQWQSSYGIGERIAKLPEIQQTSDNGFIIGGQIEQLSEYTRVWILKLNNSGLIEWQKAYSENIQSTVFRSIQRTSDSGYVAAGFKGSFATIVKLNSLGDVEWVRSFYQVGNEYFVSVKQTSDNGYILTGRIRGSSGGDDIMVVKLSSSGAIQWQKEYRTTNSVVSTSIQQTRDGGYIVVGNFSQQYPEENGLMLKLDSDGNIQWQKYFSDWSFSDVKVTNDGFYIIAGEILSESGYEDYWVLKLNLAGEINADCSIIQNANLTAYTSNLESIDLSLYVISSGFDSVYSTNADRIITDVTANIQCDGFTNLPGKILNTLKLSKSGNNIVLNWNQPDDSCSPIAYGIYRGSLPWTTYNHATLYCDVTGLN